MRFYRGLPKGLSFVIEYAAGWVRRLIGSCRVAADACNPDA
jgi:hypothetical protein